MKSAKSLSCFPVTAQLCVGLQLQKDGDWETRVDAAFAKLDSNGDGYIDLEELLAQLPFESEESYDGERLMEVIRLY